MELEEGTKIYRVVDEKANGAGGFWFYEMPDSKTRWRSGSAVKDSWNDNGYFVEHTVGKGGLKAWEGLAAGQQYEKSDGKEFCLKGGVKPNSLLRREQLIPLSPNLLRGRSHKMDDALRKQLLERKFQSHEYMEEMRNSLQEAIDSLVVALQQFHANPPKDEECQQWQKADWPETWEERVLKNLRGMHKSISEGIEQHKKGDTSYIRSATGSLHGVFGNLDNLGWKWWGHLSSDFENDFRQRLARARDMATNIWWTTGGYWAPDEILDEQITGLISEADLKRYLKPGEAP